MILKLQQVFRREKRNVSTEEANNTKLSVNDDKTIQSVSSIAIFVYGEKKI